MVKSVEIFGEIGSEVLLTDVMQKILDGQDFNKIHVKINSPGGSVLEGRAIRAFLVSQNKEIETECFGDCSSIATEIFLMGKKRIAYEGVRFLIHLPYSAFAIGTSDDFENYKTELEKIENEMISLYMNRDKNKKYSYEDWKEMMRRQTTFTAQELFELGFATEIKKSYQSKVFNMKKKKSIFAKLQKMLNSVKALTFVQDDKEFEVLTEQETPAVGDAVILVETGEPAPDGEYKYDEQTTLVVKDGIIVEIITQNEELEQTLEAIAKAISDLRAENEAIKKVLKESLKVDALAFKKDKSYTNSFQPSVKFKKNFNK